MGAPFACHRFVDDNQPDASTATANRSNACLSALAEDNACNTVSGLATANEMDTIVLPAAAIAPAKAARHDEGRQENFMQTSKSKVDAATVNLRREGWLEAGKRPALENQLRQGRQVFDIVGQRSVTLEYEAGHKPVP